MRYFTRTLRFEALYRFKSDDMALPTAVWEYAMKKYKRHCTVPESLLIDVAAELEARVASSWKTSIRANGSARLCVLRARRRPLWTSDRCPAVAGHWW
eukprot:m.300763 g.300763  ORF g.300763 m.300763 type:complete len:98 (-) comp27258_c0_seq1:4880-5173(-)